MANKSGWRRRLQGASTFLCGALASAVLLIGLDSAGAFDLGGVGKSLTNLANIKRNLDADVKLLTGDAKTLLTDKEKLLEIKNQLLKLAKDTRAQIDSISGLVTEVEGHIKRTQTNIATTSDHVDDIDDVRKALGGK